MGGIHDSGKLNAARDNDKGRQVGWVGAARMENGKTAETVKKPTVGSKSI